MKACRIQRIQVKLDKYKALEKSSRFIMKIDMERYNKSTMPVNAKKYFITHRGFELTTSAHRLALHYPSPLPTAPSRQPKKDCSDSTDIGIG